MCADPSAPAMGDQAKGRGFGRAPSACLVVLGLAACGPSLDLLETARVLAGRAPTTDLPAVPGADRPYPNLGTVPARPVPPSPEERRRIADALVADRENARHVGLPVMPARAGNTPPPAQPPPPLTAASATPLGPFDAGADVPGGVAPLAPLPAPPPSPIAGAPRPGEAAADPPAPAPPVTPQPRAEAAPSPAAPSLPPRPDPSVIVDRAALPPPRATPAVTLPAGQGAALAFPPGSATLPEEARAVVARFAAGRGGAVVRVTGYRDSTGGDLGLALARAQAVAQALRGAGTPAEAIELAAEPRPGPAGRGAEMRLVYSP